MSDINPATTPDDARIDKLMQQPAPDGRPLWLIGGVGCVLLLCLGLLLGGSVVLMRSRWTSPAEAEAAADAVSSSTDKSNSRKTGAIPGTLREDEPKVADPVATEPADEASVTNTPSPELSPITFALKTTAAGEPVSSDFSFKAGTIRIYAVFEYRNVPAGSIWTQIWYHNGSEVLSTSQPWLEDEAGVYDYVIEADGDPLPTGQWALEFYIDGKLLTAGSFVIEGDNGTLDAAEAPDLVDIPKVYVLAYTKWNGEKHDLYVGDTNGSQERFILRAGAGPSWSGDGRYIFFYGEEGVDQQLINGIRHPLPGVANGIIRLNAAPLPAGLGQLRLFQGHGWNDGTARWANVSPDGAMIAYDGDRGGGRRIYFLGTTANQQFKFEIIGEQADWSPDSQKVVYRSGRDNKTGIWISNRTDSGHVRITTGGTDSFPTWSPDGKTIAFSRDAGGNVDIYTVEIDGSNLQRLTEAPGHDTLPVYLPDGHIVFRSARTGSWSIWKMSGDGSNQTEIIGNAPVGPEWSFSKMGVMR